MLSKRYCLSYLLSDTGRFLVARNKPCKAQAGAQQRQNATRDDFQTVRWLILRSAAMILLGWPAITSSMICRWRSVSSAMGRTV